ARMPRRTCPPRGPRGAALLLGGMPDAWIPLQHRPSCHWKVKTQSPHVTGNASAPEEEARCQKQQAQAARAALLTSARAAADDTRVGRSAVLPVATGLAIAIAPAPAIATPRATPTTLALAASAISGVALVGTTIRIPAAFHATEVRLAGRRIVLRHVR